MRLLISCGSVLASHPMIQLYLTPIMDSTLSSCSSLLVDISSDCRHPVVILRSSFMIAQIFVCVVTRSTTAEVQHNDMMMRTNVQNDLRHEMALEMWIVSVHEKSEQL